MPAQAEFSEQEILGRCFVAASNVVGVAGSGDGEAGAGIEAQEVWNRIFDTTAGAERLYMNR